VNQHPVLDCIRRRRVARFFTDEPIQKHNVSAILDAGRWAPRGGNKRVHRFVVVTDRESIDVVRALSPGMLGHPAVVIFICIDWQEADALGIKRHDNSVYIDVGTAAENMLLAAESLGLGSGPVTSFSKAAVQEILKLPDSLQPELMVCLGKRAKVQPFARTQPRRPTRLEELVIWKNFREVNGGRTE
jgi:nitroreductase